jgi:hypothetical protein
VVFGTFIILLSPFMNGGIDLSDPTVEQKERTASRNHAAEWPHTGGKCAQ